VGWFNLKSSFDALGRETMTTVLKSE